ncbi:hypothetical protein [Limosilactobacillus mucosae]|jgi:hypothetical protein|uniref:hypothetical protein n=1 Tax=Limosilactobacillus mucosae TaxID=97478 RepID=UPI000EE04152|nr:hypothetical protein [Limosilactobacillus mucosae]HAM87137.1 hypothetical protein [Lactobacillus sp.]
MNILELIIIAIIVYFAVDLLLRVLSGLGKPIAKKMAEDSLTINDLLAKFFSFAIGLSIIAIGIVLYFKWN